MKNLTSRITDLEVRSTPPAVRRVFRATVIEGENAPPLPATAGPHDLRIIRTIVTPALRPQV